MIDIINMCIMYRFYTYYKYIIIILYLFSLKLQKWFSQAQCHSPLNEKELCWLRRRLDLRKDKDFSR